MTTIIVSTKDNKIYCDARYARDNLIESDTAAKWLNHNELPWFICGTFADAKKLFDHYFLGKEVIDWKNFNATLFGRLDGEIVLISAHDDEVWVQPVCNEPYLCYGSGGDFALSALDHGKSPIDAIQYAMTRDMNTGGKISCFDYTENKWAF